MKIDSFDNYIDQALSLVKFKEAHLEVRRELFTHFEEANAQARRFGVSDDVIEREVLRTMGSAKELGLQLNQVHRPKIDWILISVTLSQVAVGLFAMKQFDRLALQSLWFIIGLVLLIGLVFVKPVQMQRLAPAIYLATLGFGLWAIFNGNNYEGQPYVSVGQLNIKFVDLSVVLFVVSLSGMLSKFSKGPLIQKCAVTAASLLPLIAYLAIGSIYPAFVFLGGTLIMMIVAGWAVPFVMSFSGIAAGLFSIFLKTEQFPSAADFSKLVVSEGHTDFIFMYLRSSYAGLATLMVILSLSLIVYLASSIKGTKSVYGRTAIAGTIGIFAVGTLWGLLSNLGFIPMPVTGVNFPFLSYGGSMMIAHLALIGWTLGIHRRRNIQVFE